MTEQEHQQFPGDYEAQVGQGPDHHSEETFGQSDRGILMIRRMLSEQLEAMEADRNPHEHVGSISARRQSNSKRKYSPRRSNSRNQLQ